MKNIFLLPTDKPSRLIKNNHNQLLLTIQTLPLDRELGCFPQNIYITSDEEIKVGDWTLMFDDFGNLFLCDKPQQYLGIEKGHHLNKGLRKIILTTDPELIADGAQAIDDEFLEWFVKNSSCEFVKTELLNVSEVLWEEYFKKHGVYPKYPYYEKIIIPQEEPKQEGYICPQTNVQCDDECCVSAKDCHIEASIGILSEPKQKTLEEAAENYSRITLNKNGLMSDKQVNGFIAGAKWQQENISIKILDCDNIYAHVENGFVIIEKNDKYKKSYSQEEAGELVYNIIGEYAKHYGVMIDGAKLNELFEQFKKK
jgi:hypothetical protein